jgi:hypothetical protein
VHPAPVGAQPGQAAEGLDHEDRVGALERGVVAHELVAEDERDVAHAAPSR